jgi:predicted PurR-regulated permease PerM
MSQISNNTLKQIFFLLVIILLGIILFIQLKTFLPALLGSYTLYVILRKYMFILQARYKWKKVLAASVLMLLSFIIILLPIFLLINMMSSKISFAVQHSSQVLTSIKGFINQYELKYGFELLSDENINKISAWAANTLPSILGATINTITTIAVMYFILYFMLTDGRRMEAGFYDMVPLKDENVLLLRKEMNSLVFSNALGIPLIALLQGVVALIGYLILGVEEPAFWFVITCIASMLPIVGAAVAYIPVAVLLFASGHPTKGIIMLIFGFGIIGSVDNIFRFWLQKKLGDVHPLITVFGVIIGINLFGFIGLIFGPLLIALFILLIRIYANEFSIKRSGE